MKEKIVIILIGFAFNAVYAELATWYPFVPSRGEETKKVDYIAQKDSAVIILWGPLGEFYDLDRPVPMDPVEVNFPTILISESRSTVEMPFEEIDHLVYAPSNPEIVQDYDFSLGSGWILHKKHNLSLENLWIEDRLVESLGWIYIRDYPWIYGQGFGWRYIIEGGICWNSNCWWMFEEGVGWFWTTRDIYPYIYSLGYGWIKYGEVSL